MEEPVEVVIPENGVRVDGLEKIEDAIAALDSEIADSEGCRSFGDELVVDKDEEVCQFLSDCRYKIWKIVKEFCILKR